MVFAAVYGAHLISFLLTNIDPRFPIMISHLSAFHAAGIATWIFESSAGLLVVCCAGTFLSEGLFCEV